MPKKITFSFANQTVGQGKCVNNMVSRTASALVAKGYTVHMENEETLGQAWEEVWLEAVCESDLAVIFLDDKYKAGGKKTEKHKAGCCAWEYNQLMNGTNTNGCKVMQITYAGKTAADIAATIASKV